MVEYRSHKIRISSIPQEKCLFKSVDSPNGLNALLWVATGAVFVMSKTKLISVPLLAATSIQTFKNKRTYFAVYDNFIVIYDENGKDFCDIIYNNEIKNWMIVDYVKKPQLWLELRDGEKIIISKGVGFDSYLFFKRNYKEMEKIAKK